MRFLKIFYHSYCICMIQNHLLNDVFLRVPNYLLIRHFFSHGLWQISQLISVIFGRHFFKCLVKVTMINSICKVKQHLTSTRPDHFNRDFKCTLILKCCLFKINRKLLRQVYLLYGYEKNIVYLSFGISMLNLTYFFFQLFKIHLCYHDYDFR